MAEEPFLSRWSKRKTEARTGTPPAADPQPASPATPATVAIPATEPPPPAPLPCLESLTPESDFSGFMQPDVDEGLKRQALKTLFQNPHFNVMDGLDVYIDDYSKPDPLPPSWLGQLKAVARLGAYQEQPVEEATGALSAVVPPASEAVEKPSAEQGLAPPPSSETSDTGDGGPAPPPVPE